MNHSCDLNCELEHWIVGGFSRCFFVIKYIVSLEELTFNYDWKLLDNVDDATKCFCHTNKCKGIIQTLKETPNDESE